jgi:hypothetical protein
VRWVKPEGRSGWLGKPREVIGEEGLTGSACALTSEPRSAGELQLTILLSPEALTPTQLLRRGAMPPSGWPDTPPRVQPPALPRGARSAPRAPALSRQTASQAPPGASRLEPQLLCAEASEARPGGECLPHKLTLHLLQLLLQEGVASLIPQESLEILMVVRIHLIPNQNPNRSPTISFS